MSERTVAAASGLSRPAGEVGISGWRGKTPHHSVGERTNHGVAEPRLVSGEAVELDIRVARAGSRVPALLIDIFCQIVLFIMLNVIVSLLFLILGISGILALDEALSAGIVTVMIVLVLIGYPAAMETLTRGRTVGKLALGLRVVRDDGGPIRFRQAITRALVGAALEWPGLVLPPLTWIASLWTMIANPHGKRLG
ncbi:MAG TPA: RDD family protein, partial [Micromonosporaceae bacterium]|nr:RDD family protein [Micromonosporaceae bacterium]